MLLQCTFVDRQQWPQPRLVGMMKRCKPMQSSSSTCKVSAHSKQAWFATDYINPHCAVETASPAQGMRTLQPTLHLLLRLVLSFLPAARHLSHPELFITHSNKAASHLALGQHAHALQVWTILQIDRGCANKAGVDPRLPATAPLQPRNAAMQFVGDSEQKQATAFGLWLISNTALGCCG